MKIKSGMEQSYSQLVAECKDDFIKSGTLAYMERWADLMEKAIAEGVTVAKTAEQTNHAANTEGITGFMFGNAVTVLSQMWEYGEELRHWHNSHYGYTGEGVVNPAIIRIEEDDEDNENSAQDDDFEYER